MIDVQLNEKIEMRLGEVERLHILKQGDLKRNVDNYLSKGKL